MRIPFLQKVTVKKITSDATGTDRERATKMLEGLLRELPELIAALVVDVSSGRTLAAYTTQTQLDPYKVSSRTAAEAQHFTRVSTVPGLADQQLADQVVVLEEQLHLLRLTPDQRWCCLLIVNTYDTNLALARDLLRKYTD